MLHLSAPSNCVYASYIYIAVLLDPADSYRLPPGCGLCDLVLQANKTQWVKDWTRLIRPQSHAPFKEIILLNPYFGPF